MGEGYVRLIDSGDFPSRGEEVCAPKGNDDLLVSLRKRFFARLEGKKRTGQKFLIFKSNIHLSK